MSQTLSIPLVLIAAILAPSIVAGTDQNDRIEPQLFARHVLTTADTVLKYDYDPPTRQQMIVDAARSVFRKASQPIPNGLGRRVSAATSDQALLKLLEELWTAAHGPSQASDAELQAAALEGMLNDPSSGRGFVPAKEFKVQQQIRGNRYVGIGIQIAIDSSSDERLPAIITPFPRGPARLAGARAGDRILEVNGVSTQGKTLEQVIDMIRGEEGAPITLLVQSNRSDETRTLRMQRGVIPFRSFVGFQRISEEEWDFHIDPAEPIGYLQLTAIRASTLHELRQHARTLEASGIRALVLDLRNAGGGDSGDIQHAVLVADELLDEGPIGRVLDAGGNARQFDARPDSLFKGWSIVVLVNQYTRGECEFLAAALQDNHRATIVGERTRGAALLRTPYELPDGLGAVVLHTGVMLRADGRPLQRPQSADSTQDSLAIRTVAPPAFAPVRPVPSTALTQEEYEKSRAQLEQLANEAAQSGQPKGPPRTVKVPVGDKTLELLVGDPQAAARPTAIPPGDWGVRPDHAVPTPPGQLQAWMHWRREQDVPDPPPTGPRPAPADPQLTKALELLRSALQNAEPSP